MGKAHRYIYIDCEDPQLVGGKGASLSRMKRLGLSVPPFLTISTAAHRDLRSGKLTMKELMDSYVLPQVKEMFPKLGAGQMVSVRSGAPRSMPGMMDTILNLGADPEETPREYITLMKSWMSAAGMDTGDLDNGLNRLCENSFVFYYYNIDSYFLTSFINKEKPAIPENALQALQEAIEMVFQSWDSERAVAYRKAHNIPDSMGTACTIQAMVFGSKMPGGSGVMLTRGAEDGALIDWADGEQGDAVVGGGSSVSGTAFFKKNYATQYKKLVEIGEILEKEYRDAMDVEFTIEHGHLHILQCRPAKRTPVEAMRIACQLYDSGVWSQDDASSVEIVDDSTQIVKVIEGDIIAEGIPVTRMKAEGNICVRRTMLMPGNILCVSTATPDDFENFQKAAGVVTSLGGPTCHAALLARELQIPCIVGTETPINMVGEMATMLPDGRVVVDAQIETRTIPGKWSARLKEIVEHG